MYTIVVPGKLSALKVRYASATSALKKYREMRTDGLYIDLRDAKGDPVTAFDLEEMAKTEPPEAEISNQT